MSRLTIIYQIIARVCNTENRPFKKEIEAKSQNKLFFKTGDWSVRRAWTEVSRVSGPLATSAGHVKPVCNVTEPSTNSYKLPVHMQHLVLNTKLLEQWVCQEFCYENKTVWKEATAAMTALVYSGLHTRLYRGYVQVY
jgi:hypothetical protein